MADWRFEISFQSGKSKEEEDLCYLGAKILSKTFKILGYKKYKNYLLGVDIFSQTICSENKMEIWSDRLVLDRTPKEYQKDLAKAFPNFRIQSKWQLLEWNKCYTDGTL